MNEKKWVVWWGRAVFAAALVLMLLAGVAAQARAQTSGRLVVVAANWNTLYLWQEGDDQPRRIPFYNIANPSELQISPQGDRVLFHYRALASDIVLDYKQHVWMVSITDGRLLYPLVGQIKVAEKPLVDIRDTDGWRWSQDGATLYFNTGYDTPLGFNPADDLWRWDVASGEYMPLLPDMQGGTAVFPPDPENPWIALVSSGGYGGMAGYIAFYNTETGAYDPGLRFPHVSTASDWLWYPTVVWLPNGHVRTAIPRLALQEKQGPVDLFDVAPGSSAELLGTVQANLFWEPVFSPDGEHVLYTVTRTSPEGSTTALMVAEPDGSNAVEYATIPLLRSSLRWFPQGERFLYAHYDEEWHSLLWSGELGQPPQRFPAPDVHISALTWADEETFVYLVPNEDRSETLYYATVGAPDQATPIFTMEGRPLFDAARP